MVRLGCGCLIAILCLAVLIMAVQWTVTRALEHPDFPVSTATAEDGRRAQAKIYELIRRPAGGRGPDRRQPTVLTEQELNAFVANHLVEVDQLPVSDLGLSLPGPGMMVFAGRLPLEHLVAGSMFASLRGLLPARWAKEPVWIVLGGELRVEADQGGRRWLRLDVRRLALGRQRLPAFMARLLLDPAALRWLRWPMPAWLQDITVETGRLLIRPAA